MSTHDADRLRELILERDEYRHRWEIEMREGAEAMRERDALRSILIEIYEGQPAACVGPVAAANPAPCKTCIWCRVRAVLYSSLQELINQDDMKAAATKATREAMASVDLVNAIVDRWHNGDQTGGSSIDAMEAISEVLSSPRSA